MTFLKKKREIILLIETNNIYHKTHKIKFTKNFKRLNNIKINSIINQLKTYTFDNNIMI